MDAPLLTDDFKEFLRLLNVHDVDEIVTTISGVTYDECRANAESHDVDGILVPVISRDDLKRNKRAAGRHKDLADLEHLP